MKVVFVNGERIDPADVIEQRRLMEPDYRGQLAVSMTPAEVEARLDQDALDNVIDRTLLAQAAEARSLAVPEPEVTRRFKQLKRDAGGSEAFYAASGLTRAADPAIRDNLRRQLRLERFFEVLGRDAPRPNDQDCREAYERNPGRFVVPEMILASHILRKPRGGQAVATIFADMLNIRQAILDGAEFAAVAKAVSDDPDHGGNLGYFPRGKMVPAFDRVVFALVAGEVSEVFQTEFGYHLVKVFDRRPEHPRGYDEVREIIRGELWESRKTLRIGSEADALRAAAEIREVEES